MSSVSVQGSVPMSRRIYHAGKRGVDIAASGLGLLVLMPVLLLVAALVRVNLGSPVFFRQARPGLDGQVFYLLKFRTMLAIDADHVTDAERLTRFGHFLRRSSLDELPTLLNVARGEMTLVGPRPLLVEYLERYTPEQARRHDVRPGITGLAQVAGRNGVPWEQRLALDVKYVDTRSAAVDLGILVRTVALVVGRRGISEEGQATMREFVGITIVAPQPVLIENAESLLGDAEALAPTPVLPADAA